MLFRSLEDASWQQATQLAAIVAGPIVAVDAAPLTVKLNVPPQSPAAGGVYVKVPLDSRLRFAAVTAPE